MYTYIYIYIYIYRQQYIRKKRSETLRFLYLVFFSRNHFPEQGSNYLFRSDSKNLVTSSNSFPIEVLRSKSSKILAKMLSKCKKIAYSLTLFRVRHT